MSNQVYHDTYTSAIQTALANLPQGVTVDEDEYFREVTVGQGRPKKDMTTRHSIKLIHESKPRFKQYLHIQVYNRGTENNTYELNFYIL
jgi:hypothetical protein